MRSSDGILGAGERLDDLGRDELFIIQNPEFFCFGIDAVLLSDYIKVHGDEQVLDLCSGNGIIPILLSAKTRAKKIYGLEIQKALVDMANRSISYNKLSPRVEMIEADVKDIRNCFKADSFDVVSVNPPYMSAAGGVKNPDERKLLARHEIACDFSDVVSAAAYLLKQKGRFYLVHRPLRLVEILKTMSDAGIEPKSMRLVAPFANKEPNLVLIEGIKGAAPELRIAKPLVVYKEPGKYTEEVIEIYGHDEQ